nr:putative ribonuclease H-like domain-containing protein [Tanacetum cinerariifolium]
EDDSDSNDEPDVFIIHSTPTLVVLVVEEATTQNDGTKSDHATTNANNLEELTELQALQRQEQAGKREADQLGLAFPSLNPILGVGSTPIGSSVSAGSTPLVSAGSTPPMSPCASPISADRHFISADKCYVPAGKPTGSAGRPVSAGRPTGSAGRPVFAGKPTGSAGRLVFAGKPTGSVGRPVSTGKPTGSAGRPVSAVRPSGSATRTPVPVGCILGKLTSNTSSKRFPRASSVENLDIHDGLKIFDCPKAGIFTSSSYDEDFSGPDANNLDNSLNVSSTITKRIHNIHPTSQVLGDINSPVQTRSHVKHKCSSKSAFISYIHDQRRNNHIYFQLCMFSCFLSQEEPTTVAQAFTDPDWVEAMQRIFKYLTAYPKLGLWYPRDSPFDLEAFSDSDYAGANGDMKSTTSGCQFLRRRLISWHCKKQTIVATSSCEAKYVAVASCCGQWFLFTFAGRVTFCWLFPIPAGDLDSAGHMLFLLIYDRYCWGLVATIDGTVYTVTKAFIRSPLQLDDLNAIDTMTNEEIFVRLRDIGSTLVYEDLDQMNKEEFEEYDLKHQIVMLSIKVHRFEKKHGRKIKFNGRNNARFDKKLVKCFNCKQMGHFSRECRAQGGQNSNNYQKYKSKEAGKDESDSKAMVVVDGSIDWDKQTEEGNTKPKSLENFGVIAGIKIESDADSEGEVVSANDAIPAGVSVSAGNVVAAVVSPQSETEFALMGLSTEITKDKENN